MQIEIDVKDANEKLDQMLKKADRLVGLLTEAKELIDSMGCTCVTNNFDKTEARIIKKIIKELDTKKPPVSTDGN